MDTILCGYRDDSRLWDEPEEVEEQVYESDAERQVALWVVDMWDSAQKIDNYEEWGFVRSAIFGAMQTANLCGRMDVYCAMSPLSDVAFAHQLRCIHEEWAK